jgi:hypothetical protein
MDYFLSTEHKILQSNKRDIDKKHPRKKYNGYSDSKSKTNNHRRKRCRIRDQKCSTDMYVPTFNPKTHNWWDIMPYDPKIKHICFIRI